MSTWSRTLVATLLVAAACSDSDSDPQDDTTSAGSTDTGMTGVTMNPVTTDPNPTTGDPATTDDPGTTDATSSSGGADSSSGGADASTGATDTGATGDSGTTGDADTGTTTSAAACDAGDGPDFMVGNAGTTDYLFDGVADPAITVVRGCTYTFTIDAPGHPFFIKSVQGTGVGNAYSDGVTNNGTSNGVITWDVPLAAPDDLFYNCQFHASMTGTITVIDP